jgi:glucose/mannose-6-phosphate isomerase
VTKTQHLDSLGMWETTTGLPEHLAHTLQHVTDVIGAGSLAGTGALGRVALVGTGSNGTAAAAAAAWAAPGLEVPVWVGQGPLPAAFGRPETLVVALSHTGDDPETTEAAEAAQAAGATVVAVTNGGALSLAAAANGWAQCSAGVDRPNARSVVLPALVVTAVVLWRAGLLDDPSAAIAEATEGLGRRRDAFAFEGSAPEQVARRIGRTIPLFYAAGDLPAVAAHHWKSQINENVKSPAFSARLADAAAHDVVGWGQHGDITRQVFTLVALRQAGETPADSQLFDSVLAATDEVMADVITVAGEGASELARFMDLVLLGDLVSLHLARREEIDPGPVAAWTDVGSGPH